jgi:hypothetical protein
VLAGTTGDDGYAREAGRDVDAALRRLPVLGTYSANMFRISGLATDAGATAIRRRREEIEMAARLGTPMPSRFGDLAPEQTPEPEHFKAAFEAMAAPVTRLVHEAFWLSGLTSHDAAVGAHCRALAAEAAGRGAAAESLWGAALDAWAKTLAEPEFGALLVRRAVDLDDPRVDATTVAALRERLPRRVLAPNAVLAVAAATADDGAAVTRHLRALRESPFPATAVTEALREACDPVVRAVSDSCAELLRVAAEEPADVPSVADRLVRDIAPRVRVAGAVLPEDRLADALHDEIAGTLTRAAVAWTNSGGAPADGLELLARASGFARDASTRELVQRKSRELSDASVLAVVEPWCSAGDPDGAGEVLRLWRRRQVDPARRADLDRVLADPRAVRAVMARSPVRATWFGCGMRPYGHRAWAEETWVETRCATVFWVPVYPLAAYLSDEEFVYAKVPLAPWVRRARYGVPVLLAVLLVAALLGWVFAVGLVAVVEAVLLGAALQRRRTIEGWLDEQVGPRSREG